MARDQGVRGAVGAIVAAASAARPAEPVQMELLPPGLDGLPETQRARVEPGVRAARAGRPPGAENKMTREVKDFVRQVMGDPVIERARWMLHTPESLAAVLGCTKLEAFDRLDRIRAELSRLWYAPAAPVDEDGRPVPTLNLVVGNQVVGTAEAPPPWVYAGGPVVDQTQQNQSLSNASPAVSHGDVSHEPDK
ncbi:MAG: hypothetical protein HZA68_13015 [Rhodovulum sp.]|nr:hypothetical protein [Rhodovulum sp.]